VPTETTTRPGRDRDVIVATFCGCLLLANVAATKLVQVGPAWTPGGLHLLPLIFDGGAILYPVSYILGDVMAEVYGFRVARRAIVLGFVLSGVAALSFWAVDSAPGAADWPNQAAWHAVLGFVPRIVLASLIAYLVGQLINARALVWLRDRSRPTTSFAPADTGATDGTRHPVGAADNGAGPTVHGAAGTDHGAGATASGAVGTDGPTGPGLPRGTNRPTASPVGSLWFRLLGSTVVGAAADTALFCTIAYIGLVGTGTLVNYIVTGYFYKLAVEAVLLPVTTRVIPVVKRREAHVG